MSAQCELFKNCRTGPETVYPPIVVVLDNDEAIGSWSDLSLLYSMVRMLQPQVQQAGLVFNVDIAAFAALAAQWGCIRPHLGFLYDVLTSLRHFGYVSHIVMCTAASDDTGWVQFLYQMLEHWFEHTYPGRGPVYDMIVHRSQLAEWAARRDLTLGEDCMLKDMAHVRSLLGVPPATPVAILDDRVHCAVDTDDPKSKRGAVVRISLPRYATAMDGIAAATQLLRPLASSSPQGARIVHETLQRHAGQLSASWSRMADAPHSSYFTQSPHEDTALLTAVRQLVQGLVPLPGDLRLAALHSFIAKVVPDEEEVTRYH